jgi:PAS domain-containing protein
LVNAAAEKLFGYDSSALLEQPLSRLISERHGLFRIFQNDSKKFANVHGTVPKPT